MVEREGMAMSVSKQRGGVKNEGTVCWPAAAKKALHARKTIRKLQGKRFQNGFPRELANITSDLSPKLESQNFFGLSFGVG
jgi:hypothetical protein